MPIQPSGDRVALTSEDHDKLRQIINEYNQRPIHSPSYYSRVGESDDFQNRYIHVARSPIAGIPKLSTITSGTGSPVIHHYLPGMASCDIWRILDGPNIEVDDRLFIQEEFTENVYNISSQDIPAEQFIPIWRDAWGRWVTTPTTPGAYFARTGPLGITAINTHQRDRPWPVTGTGTYDDVPGFGDCDIFHLVTNRFTGQRELKPVLHTSRTVYNLAPYPIAANTDIAIWQDAYGNWFTIPTSQTQRIAYKFVCHDGELVRIEFVNGAITKFVEVSGCPCGDPTQTTTGTGTAIDVCTYVPTHILLSIGMNVTGVTFDETHSLECIGVSGGGLYCLTLSDSNPKCPVWTGEKDGVTVTLKYCYGLWTLEAHLLGDILVSVYGAPGHPTPCDIPFGLGNLTTEPVIYENVDFVGYLGGTDCSPFDTGTGTGTSTGSHACPHVASDCCFPDVLDVAITTSGGPIGGGTPDADCLVGQFNDLHWISGDNWIKINYPGGPAGTTTMQYTAPNTLTISIGTTGAPCAGKTITNITLDNYSCSPTGPPGQFVEAVFSVSFSDGSTAQITITPP